MTERFIVCPPDGTRMLGAALGGLRLRLSSRLGARGVSDLDALGSPALRRRHHDLEDTVLERGFRLLRIDALGKRDRPDEGAVASFAAEESGPAVLVLLGALARDDEL